MADYADQTNEDLHAELQRRQAAGRDVRVSGTKAEMVEELEWDDQQAPKPSPGPTPTPTPDPVPADAPTLPGPPERYGVVQDEPYDPNSGIPAELAVENADVQRAS